jgi:hypothetical protein
MVSPGMLRRVALVRTDISVELGALFIRVTIVSELGTTLALSRLRRLLITDNVLPNSPILVTLMLALSSSETSALTRTTRRTIPENDILHSHHRENLKSHIALTG